MKKLLILAAVSAMACVSEAYTIQWGCLNVKTPIADNVKVSQSGIIGSGEAMTGLAINLYWVDSNSSDVYIDQFTTSAGKSTGNIIGNGTDSALYTAMVADQGASWKPQYHMTATYTTADGKYEYSGYVTSAVAIGNLSSKNVGASANFGSSTTGSWSYTANDPEQTPEPTSGLLMLLGMAGLALRRKRA